MSARPPSFRLRLCLRLVRLASALAPLDHKKELRARWEAELLHRWPRVEERAQQFVTGTGESIGLPELVPDTNVALLGLGRGFSKTYYLSEATHTIDGNGYQTTFKVQETTV